jgi:hypothetical protein
LRRSRCTIEAVSSNDEDAIARMLRILTEATLFGRLAPLRRGAARAFPR